MTGRRRCGIYTQRNITKKFKKKTTKTPKHEILPFVTTWMDLESIMVNETCKSDRER